MSNFHPYVVCISHEVWEALAVWGEHHRRDSSRAWIKEGHGGWRAALRVTTSSTASVEDWDRFAAPTCDSQPTVTPSVLEHTTPSSVVHRHIQQNSQTLWVQGQCAWHQVLSKNQTKALFFLLCVACFLCVTYMWRSEDNPVWHSSGVAGLLCRQGLEMIKLARCVPPSRLASEAPGSAFRHHPSSSIITTHTTPAFLA